MSPLKQFMDGATQILDAHERMAAPKAQPPFFVRTTWLFSELDLLVLPDEHALLKGMKIARLNKSLPEISRLLALVETNTRQMDPGRQRHERGLICGFIREQLKRELA
jgi:hypothetical protein